MKTRSLSRLYVRTLRNILPVAVAVLGLCGLALSRTHPVAHGVSAGNDAFTGGTITIYPTSIQGWPSGAEPATSAIRTDATPNQDLGDSTVALNTGGVRDEIANGTNLLNSGTNHIGSIALGLNALPQQKLTGSGTAEDLTTTAERTNALGLQCRVGTRPAWTNVADGTCSSDGSGKGAFESVSNVAVPIAVNGQPLVPLRWFS